MKDFWQEIWGYLGEFKPDVSCSFIACMWEASQFLEDKNKWPHLDLDVPNWAKSKLECQKECDIHLFLCEVCKRIAHKTKKKLPENLHSRMVLGAQNDHTKDYIKLFGV